MSREKQPEGIALLSMYNDEEDEEVGTLDEHGPVSHGNRGQADLKQQLVDDIEEQVVVKDFTSAIHEDTLMEDVFLKALTAPQPQRDIDLQVEKTTTGKLAIVDYAHDDVVASPEHEEGEFVDEDSINTTTRGELEGKPSSEFFQVVTSIIQESQSSEHLELLQFDDFNDIIVEPEVKPADAMVMASIKNGDPLDTFLPPPTKIPCSEDLQKKIDNFLLLKRRGRSFNAEVRNKKDYRNPDFLLHAVRYQDIDQIGSCFRKDVFDPHGYERMDYYDEIEADMRKDKERKEQELKKSPKVDFVSGGIQPGSAAPISTTGFPVPGASATGSLSGSSVSDVISRDRNKKSKWDKVDGNGRMAQSTTAPDSVTTMIAHSSVTSATGIGVGYPDFARQKRQEAEERRSSDKQSDSRRS